MTLSSAELLASQPEAKWREILASLTDAQHEELLWDWEFWARPNQKEPPGDWLTWLVLSGRGYGKTRMGSETIRKWACGKTPLARGRYRRFLLVAETAADARDVMVEGESGILSVHPKDFRPLYEPSKRRLTWPNGASATLFNATEPDQLRGPQGDAAWLDELAKWQYARETWDMLQFGLRLGDSPRQIVTTTPRPIPLVKELLKSPTTVVTRGSTMENRGNLAPSFLKQIQARYKGTRLGRQEIEAEVLEDNPNALWTRAQLDAATIKRNEKPQMARIAVAVDPSGADDDDDEDTADAIGIVAAGKGVDGKMYVLADGTCYKSPGGWGKEVVDLYRKLQADVVVGEVNFGGAMVEFVVRTADETVPFKEVRASRGKHKRAEPVAALYEQGRVKHVGSFPELEDEMCTFGKDGLSDGKSPNRLDALVWAATELMLSEVGTAGIEHSDWMDWKEQKYPKYGPVIAVASVGYAEGDAFDPPSLTVWGRFVDQRGNSKVMLLYGWTGHLSGPDLASVLEVVCSNTEKGTVELKRIAKTMGANFAPRFAADRVLLLVKGEAMAAQRELYKALSGADVPVEPIDPKRWGELPARLQGIQHLFTDGAVFAPMSRVFARKVADNIAEHPNAAHAGLANCASVGLLYMRDTGMLLRSEEHSREQAEAGMFRGRETSLYDA